MSTAVKVMERPAAGVVQEITAAEIDRQIETAKRYPRVLEASRGELLEICTMSEDVATDCMYALPRKEKGKTKMIEGPSVRFAENLVYCWGNIRAGARIVDEGQEFITAQGWCADLQKNTGLSVEVKRKITGQYGRFSADMVAMTANAACSIALRNSIFDCIPKALWWDVYLKTRQRAVGDEATLQMRRDRAIGYFVKAGAEEAKIYTALGIEDKSQITLDILAILKGLAQAVKDGEIPIDRVFEPDAAEERARITLGGEDQFNGIDKQLQGKGAQPKEKGGDKSDAAPEKSKGDGSSTKGPADKDKPKTAKGKAGSAAAPKPEEGGGQPPESVASTAEATGDKAKAATAPGPVDYAGLDDILARVEDLTANGSKLSARKYVDTNREELQAAVDRGPKKLAERAKKALDDYPPQAAK